MKNLNERSVRILASLGLILTTMIWGFAFVVMKNSVDLIPPTYLLAIRFSMSAVLLAMLFHKNLFAADRQTILCGAILGEPQNIRKEGFFCHLPGGEEINFYQVIPLHREELEYKLEHNAEALLEKLAEADFVVHPDRPADLL